MENKIPRFGDWNDFMNMKTGIGWRNVNGKDIEFEIFGPADLYPCKQSEIKVLKSATFEDHLEELWLINGTYYRHAGGGRGFFWTQELLVISMKPSLVPQDL